MPSPSVKLRSQGIYTTTLMDTLRRNFFVPRAYDIVVATTYDAGTTWVQTIVANLIFGGGGNAKEHFFEIRKLFADFKTQAVQSYDR
jgi:hypothetical protein